MQSLSKVRLHCVYSATREVASQVESEHLVMASGYIGTGFIGHDNPYILGISYLAVGTVHVIHVIRKGRVNSSK